MNLTPAFLLAICALLGILLGENAWVAWEAGKLRRRVAIWRIRLARLRARWRGPRR